MILRSASFELKLVMYPILKLRWKWITFILVAGFSRALCGVLRPCLAFGPKRKSLVRSHYRRAIDSR